jgi:adenosylmethionine-8-amino-7-oxononanoate aminotransferase
VAADRVGQGVNHPVDVLVIAPPFIVEREHIDRMVNTLADSIRRHA